MKIVVGSKNKTKISAVQDVFPDSMIMPLAASSNVSAQPFSDPETVKGALNRAKECRDKVADAFSVALDGGDKIVFYQWILCNWGWLITPGGQTSVASGARIALPHSFIDPLEKGKELGDLMHNYTKTRGVRHREGAVGIFTNERISRRDMFAHIVQLLRGQWE